MVAELMTVSEVARLLRLHPNTVYSQTEAGELPCFRIGKSIRYSREEIEKYLLRNKGK